MYLDNMSTIRLIGHKGNTGRMKHIALRYDFVREQVRLGTIRIEHLHTTTVDTLTNPLGKLLFMPFVFSTPVLPIRTTLRPTSFLYVLWSSRLNVLYLFITPTFSFHFAPLSYCVVELVGLYSISDIS